MTASKDQVPQEGPAAKRIYVEDLKFPIPILFGKRVVGAHCCCCCCCCCSGGTPAQQPIATPAPPPSQPSAPSPLVVSVMFQAFCRQFIDLAKGAGASEMNFEWAAIGAPNLTVTVQVKSDVTYPNWTDILTNQPPQDVAKWPAAGSPGQSWHFRALAIDSKTKKVVGQSQIVTIHPY